MYSAILSDIDPYFYFPMTARSSDDFPVDFSNNSSIEIQGFFSYEHVSDFLGPFLHLFNNSTASISELGQDLEQSTLSFWALATKNTKSIINIAGATIQAESSGDSLSIFVNSSLISSFPIKSIINFALVFDDSAGIVYINGEQAATFTATSLESVSFSADEELFVSEIVFFKEIISAQQILSLFNIGSTGSDIVRVDTGSEISFSGSFKSQFQTVWQAYGIITTKR